MCSNSDINETTLNIRSSYFSAVSDANIISTNNVITLYSSARNSIFNLDTENAGAAHFELDNNGSSNQYWLTMSDLLVHQRI